MDASRHGPVRPILTISGSALENLTVEETPTGRQFRFVLQGPDLAEAEEQACPARVEASAVPRR
jgi:6-phosphofructokinase 2